MPFGELLDISLNSMEEERFKKKNYKLIRKLSKQLHFNQTEIESILLVYYKLQKIDNDKKGLKKSHFREVLRSGFDMTDDNLIPRIYMAIDKGPSPYITIEMFAKVLSIFLRGTIMEKIDFCFKVYDLFGDGMIVRESLYHLLSNSLISQSGEDDAEEAVKDMIDVITKKMDKDRDGKISYEDYKTTVLEQPMLLEVFGQCLPSRQAVNAFQSTFFRKFSRY